MNSEVGAMEKVGLLMKAGNIPHGWNVTKKTGAVEFTLLHRVTVYRSKMDEKPIVIEGIFLAGPRGSIEQVPADLLLCCSAAGWIIGSSATTSWK